MQPLDVDEARELLLELLADDWLDEERVRLDWADDAGRLDIGVSLLPPPPPQAYKRVKRLNKAR